MLSRIEMSTITTNDSLLRAWITDVSKKESSTRHSPIPSLRGIGLFENSQKGDWKFDAQKEGIDYKSRDQWFQMLVTKIIFELPFEVFQ